MVSKHRRLEEADTSCAKNYALCNPALWETVGMKGKPQEEAQQVENPPARQETQKMQVLSPGQEDPLEEEMATHSSILPWRIPWTEKPARL